MIKAHAKVNIFLKIIGTYPKGYHEISSRFMLVNELFDTLQLVKKQTSKPFELQSNIDFPDNIIYILHEKLQKLGFEDALHDLFKSYALKLVKNIPHGGGLGGASSDGAAFLRLVNEELKLGLSKQDMIQIADGVSADMPFFISGCECANVGGKGEIIRALKPDYTLKIKLHFTNIHCNTAKVFKQYAKNYKNSCLNKDLHFAKAKELAKTLEKLNNLECLKYFNYDLNDLLNPALQIYPKMEHFMQNGWYLSGSGGCVFRRDNEDSS